MHGTTNLKLKKYILSSFSIYFYTSILLSNKASVVVFKARKFLPST